MPSQSLHKLGAFAITAAFFVGASGFAPSLRAESDPSIDWRMLETPHFTILHDSKQQELAHTYSVYAEQAWAANAPVFREWPDKTVLVLNDQTDQANGFAIGVPYPMVQAFPVLPTELDSISDYGDWGLELMTHEYAHILTFEPAHGAFGFLRRYLVGSIARPNMILPHWYLEGLAVQMETRFSSFGRLRSANFLSVPRAMSKAGVLEREDVARINESGIPDFPGGARPYLMGALMWNELVRIKGDAIIGDLNLDYSSRFPFIINGPVESRLGFDYQTLLNRAYQRAGENAKKQIAAIDAAGVTPLEKLKQPGFFSHSPQISPDGNKLVFIARTHNRDSLVELIERPAGSSEPFSKFEPRTLDDRSTAVQRASWLPNSTSLVFDSVESHARYYHFGDLFRFDLGDGRKSRLTRGARAREPVVSPDGKMIVFVQSFAGGTRLAVCAIDGSSIRSLYQPGLQRRVSRPEFIDAGELVFSEKSADGLETLRTIKLAPSEAGVPRDLAVKFKPAHFPRWSKAGLLFVSDRTGVANIYLADATMSTAKAVSNVDTRAITPEFDPRTKDLYFSALDADGPHLARVESKSWFGKRAEPPTVGSLVDYEWPHYDPPKLVDESQDAGAYSPWRWLYPRYWIPVAYYLPGFFFAEAMTQGSDPLGHHSYSLGGAYDSLTARPAFFAGYQNHATAVPLSIGAADYYEYLFTASFTRHTTTMQAMLGLGALGLGPKWNPAIGWVYQQTSIGEGAVVRDGPSAQISYSDVSQKGLEISPERGGSLSLTETRFLPTRDDREYEQTDVKGNFFFSAGLPERHAIAGFVNASIAPRMGSAFLGRTTIGGNYQTPAAQTAFMVRGYPSGEFFGRNIINGSLEYRFPISYSYQGPGTTPIFLRRWHGAVFADAVTLDGAYYDFRSLSYQATKIGSFYVGAGAELRSDITAFYNVPLTVIVGAYYGATADATYQSVVPFVGIGL